MDVNEYEETPIAKVARSWANYTTRVIAFNHLVRESLSLVGLAWGTIGILSQLTQTQTADQYRRSHDTTTRAKHEIGDDFDFLNGQILMAAWAGFESFVEDFCRATLMMDKSLLRTDLFKNVKVNPSYLLLDDEEQAESVLREAFNKDRKP